MTVILTVKVLTLCNLHMLVVWRSTNFMLVANVCVEQCFKLNLSLLIKL